MPCYRSYSSLLATLLVVAGLLTFAGCPSASNDDSADGDAQDTSASDGASPDDGAADDAAPEDGDEPAADGSSSNAVANPPISEGAITYADPVEFDEPAGITYAHGKLYIADTNNHQIRVIDLKNDYRSGTFEIQGLEPPSVPPEPHLINESTEEATRDTVPSEESEEATAIEIVNTDDAADEAATAEDPRSAPVRPPVVPEADGEGLAERLDPDFPFRGRFAWEEIGAEMPQDPKRWMNTDRAWKINDFKGKFVMLDFWTYCCINCIHILPEIKKLERAYPNQLVVIGVHSAKFETEKETENVREAVLRYEIEHPVVNDVGSTVWKQLGVSAWPTVMLIDPEGNLVYVRPSEWTFEEMNDVFKTALPYYREKGVLDEKPIKFALLRDKERPKRLNFPGKILADEKTDRLFIADSNNNRIVISSLDGQLLNVIGTGAIGQDDGAYDEATFNKPQGMALLEEMLYVADTENHLIRKIDLSKKTVTTIAGTGMQGRNAWPGTEGLGRFGEPPERYVSNTPKEYAINSPWALYVHGEDLYIAMAGPHQIWKMKLDESEIGPYAGNGREDIVDGPLLPEIPYREGFSSFAQPSGLASDGTWLYVADSEGSSIRAVPFDSGQEVKTIIGTSQLPFNRLFIFDNRDGQGLLQTTVPQFQWRGRASETEGPAMQHCLGVVHHDGTLYVADTYNNSIKMINLDGDVCTTIAGEKPQAEEPAEATASGASEDDLDD